MKWSWRPRLFGVGQGEVLKGLVYAGESGGKEEQQLVQNLFKRHQKLAGWKSRDHLLEKARPWRKHSAGFSKGTYIAATVEILLLCSPGAKGKGPHSSPMRHPRAMHSWVSRSPKGALPVCGVHRQVAACRADQGPGQLPGWRTDREESRGEVHIREYWICWTKKDNGPVP